MCSAQSVWFASQSLFLSRLSLISRHKKQMNINNNAFFWYLFFLFFSLSHFQGTFTLIVEAWHDKDDTLSRSGKFIHSCYLYYILGKIKSSRAGFQPKLLSLSLSASKPILVFRSFEARRQSACFPNGIE